MMTITAPPMTRPILFCGPMVRAILEGRKTQTRRPVKLPLRCVAHGASIGHIDDGDQAEIIQYCPFGQPGDRLWVRETFTIETNFNLDPCEPPFNDGRPVQWTESEGWGRYWEQPHYRATDPTPELVHEDDCKRCNDEGFCQSWKPSIHMPRWASRITLEVRKVRVERIQDISSQDALAEGVTKRGKLYSMDWSQVGQSIHGVKNLDGSPATATPEYVSNDNAKGAFASCYEQLYGSDAWDKNPWVWVVEFKRV